MKRYAIEIAGADLSFSCGEGQTLLAGMEQLGRRGIPVGCRGGGCGVCKVHVDDGHYETKKMSRAHISAQEEQDGYVLACRCKPRSDLSLTVVGKMQAAVYGNNK